MSENRPSPVFHGDLGSPSYLAASLQERDMRLDSLKTLVGALAHDFNNSLVPLLGYVTLIKEEIDPESDAQAYLAKMEAAFNKTGGFLDSVLLAVRPRRKFSPKPMDLAVLIENVVAEWKAGLPTSALIEIAINLSPCPVLIDELQWKQVLMHLLKNARYGLAAGGRLEINLQPVHLSEEQAQALKVPPGENFQLTLEDDGIGMTEHVLQRACEPFFTTRPKGQGLGLGLTVVHSVVQLHGGQLIIESAEDCGTRVVIWIPSKQRDAANAATENVGFYSARKSNQVKTRIVLVEREALLREVVKSYFSRYDYDVTAVENASDALNLLGAEEGRVECVIAEDGNPETSANELAAKLATEQPGMPLVLIQNKGTQADLSKSFDLSENIAVIQRPFSLMSLKALVEAKLSKA